MYVWAMSWQPPTNSFTVERPNTEAFAPVGGWNDKINPKSPWQITPPAKPSYQDDEGLKRAFGIELAKAANPFEAACKVAGEDTSKALWISFNWLADPVVIASRDIYLKTLELNAKPLDREQLAAKVLAFVDQKILSPKLGCLVPLIEAKEILNGYKLYSDILGYTGKVEIDNSQNSTTINEMTIKLVKADDKKVSTLIDQAPNIKSENVKELPSPVTLKLVKAS